MIFVIIIGLIATIFVIATQFEKHKKIKEQLLDSSYTIDESNKISGKKRDTIITICTSIYIVIVLFFLSLNLFFKVSENCSYINNQYVVSIASDSMSYKNESNVYLELNHLDNQIYKYDICNFSKIESPTDVKLYDVVLYKNEDNLLIVHRVVKIENNAYSFRGDANNYNDKNVDFSSLIGIYKNTDQTLSLLNYIAHTPSFYTFLGFVITDLTTFYVFQILIDKDIKKHSK